MNSANPRDIPQMARHDISDDFNEQFIEPIKENLLRPDHTNNKILILKISDFSTYPVFQPIFIKLWKLAHTVKVSRPKKSAGGFLMESLKMSAYSDVMEYIQRGLGSKVLTLARIARPPGYTKGAVDFERFCHDIVSMLGEHLLDMTSEEFSHILRCLYRTLSVSYEGKIQFRDWFEINSPWPIPEDHVIIEESRPDTGYLANLLPTFHESFAEPAEEKDVQPDTVQMDFSHTERPSVTEIMKRANHYTFDKTQGKHVFISGEPTYKKNFQIKRLRAARLKPIFATSDTNSSSQITPREPSHRRERSIGSEDPSTQRSARIFHSERMTPQNGKAGFHEDFGTQQHQNHKIPYVTKHFGVADSAEIVDESECSPFSEAKYLTKSRQVADSQLSGYSDLATDSPQVFGVRQTMHKKVPTFRVRNLNPVRSPKRHANTTTVVHSEYEQTYGAARGNDTVGNFGNDREHSRRRLYQQQKSRGPLGARRGRTVGQDFSRVKNQAYLSVHRLCDFDFDSKRNKGQIHPSSVNGRSIALGATSRR